MQSINEVIEEYDSSEKAAQRKITLIKFFQKHPGQRFDVMEVTEKLGDELDIGQKAIGNHLRDLEDEDILQSYGEQRIAYWLADDIIIPTKYQVLAGLRHLYAIFDTERWGIAGFVGIATSIWILLTFPFYFFYISLIISPRDSIGSIHQSEIFVVAIAMTAWLIILLLISYVLYQIRRRRIRKYDT